MAGYSVEILNAIRNSASLEYQNRVPVATQTNIATVGTCILAYDPVKNEFTNAIVNKIGMTLISSKMATNPLAMFHHGEMLMGGDIEDIFVSLAKSEGAYDPTGANPLGRRLPEVKALYYSENRQDKYVVSVSDAQLHKAFTSPDGMERLIAEIINSIYSGATFDEFVISKEILATYKANYFNFGCAAIEDEATAKAFVKRVRKAALDMNFMTTTFNKAGVLTSTPLEEQVFLVNKDVLVEVDVEVLAKAFNMGKTDFEPKIIPVDNFGSMTDTYGLLIDQDFLRIYDTLRVTKTQDNADGLFTNHFLHIHQILATCQFKNAIRFTTEVIPA